MCQLIAININDPRFFESVFTHPAGCVEYMIEVYKDSYVSNPTLLGFGEKCEIARLMLAEWNRCTFFRLLRRISGNGNPTHGINHLTKARTVYSKA